LWLPLADFGQQKVAVTHHCTFDHHFLRGRSRAESDGMLLSLLVEAMFGVVF
jgi:hypothetical protein